MKYSTNLAQSIHAKADCN